MGAWAAVALAVVTTALAVFTWKLWRSTGQLVSGAEDTAKRELRAYVALKEVNIKANQPNTLPMGEMVIRNFGRTPAYRLSISAELAFDERAAKHLSEPAAGQELGHLAPGADFTSEIRAPFCLLRGGVSAIAGATHAVFLHGVIRYTDTFGALHFTRFRVTTTPWFGTKTCGEGNDTDVDALLPVHSAAVANHYS